MLSRAQEGRVREILGNHVPGICLEHLAIAAYVPVAHLADLAAFVRNLRASGGLPDPVRRHLWCGRARDGKAADLGPVESVQPGSPPCFMSAGSGRRPALPNGTASGSVTPLMDR